MARWSNAGLVLFAGANGGGAYIATGGTVTAFSPWSGWALPANKVALSIAVTSQNEFALVGVYDKDTGKGQVAVLALWGGDQGGTGLIWHGWQQPYPGAPNIAQYTGMKLLGFVDLPIKYPTAISAVGSWTQNRVNGADGNATGLGAFDLSKQSDRDLFNTGNNADYFSRWGEAVIISKYENKAVHLDLTALFATVRAAYTTTQAAFDAARPQHPDLAWWQHWNYQGPDADSSWPQTFTGRPAWTPVVDASVSLTRPTAVLMSEHGDAAVAVATEDGKIHFFSRKLAAETATLSVGRNPTCLAYNKFADGVRNGGFVSVSRGDCQVDFVTTWGPTATVAKVLRDSRMIDPVYAETADTHGIDTAIITICDFTGKKLLNYRFAPVIWATQGGGVTPIGPATSTTAPDFECGGALDLHGQPIAISATNVN